MFPWDAIVPCNNVTMPLFSYKRNPLHIWSSLCLPKDGDEAPGVVSPETPNPMPMPPNAVNRNKTRDRHPLLSNRMRGVIN